VRLHPDNESKLAFTLEERDIYSTPSDPAMTAVGSGGGGSGIDKPTNTYSFKANNVQEYRKWVAALREVLASLPRDGHSDVAE